MQSGIRSMNDGGKHPLAGGYVKATALCASRWPVAPRGQWQVFTAALRA
jgi:hypothetical protein